MPNFSENVIKDTIKIANYILNTSATFISTANAFNIKVSTVKHYMGKVLPIINPKLNEKVKKIADYNYTQMRKRASQTHKNMGIKTKQRIEEYIFHKLVDNDTFTLKTKEIADELELCQSTITRYINIIANDEKSDIELFKRDIHGGIATFRIKSDDKKGKKSSPTSLIRNIEKIETKNTTDKKKEAKKSVIEVTKEEPIVIESEQIKGQIKWEF